MVNANVDNNVKVHVKDAAHVIAKVNDDANANAIVIISRKFAAAMGIDGQPIVAAPNMIVPFAQAQVAQSNVQVETFEDEPKKESKEEEITPQVSVDEW